MPVIDCLDRPRYDSYAIDGHRVLYRPADLVISVLGWDAGRPRLRESAESKQCTASNNGC